MESPLPTNKWIVLTAPVETTVRHNSIISERKPLATLEPSNKRGAIAVPEGRKKTAAFWENIRIHMTGVLEASRKSAAHLAASEEGEASAVAAVSPRGSVDEEKGTADPVTPVDSVSPESDGPLAASEKRDAITVTAAPARRFGYKEKGTGRGVDAWRRFATDQGGREEMWGGGREKTNRRLDSWEGMRHGRSKGL